jgi:sugar phosphate isomerase/epimerase
VKVALQIGLTPGATARDKAQWAKDHGVEGLELSVWGGLDKMRREADEVHGILPVTSVCGNAAVNGDRGFNFLHPDLAERRASIDGSIAILKFCGEVGAVGQIVPPIFGPPVVPDLAPVMSVEELEEGLMVSALQELGPIAHSAGTLFMLEPLNRYEQHYLRRQDDGARVIKAADVKGLGLLSDLFHMHIEETNTPQALRDVRDFTTHLHLADNTRMEPGSGDIDFVAAFKALVDNGFTGYMAYECGISGADEAQRTANLAKSLEFVHDSIKKARSL